MKILYASIGLLSLLIVGCVNMVDGFKNALTITNQTSYKVEFFNKYVDGEAIRWVVLPNDSIELIGDEEWPIVQPYDESRQYLRFEFYSDSVKCYDITQSNREMGPYEGATNVLLVKRAYRAEYYRYTITDTLFQLAGSCEDSLLTPK